MSCEFWPDRIEEYEHHAIKKKETRAISFQQVSEVSLSRGLVWSDVIVESSGGRSMALEGMPKADAERVKTLIDEAVHSAKGGNGASLSPVATVPAAAPDLADQLQKLAALRDQGILTDDEFAAQKAKLLNS